MSWSVGSSVASEPTIDASAPSARCVCPRITPGCSSNVRFTRSSNSRTRAIWVNIQTRRSLSSSFIRSSSIAKSRHAGAELRGGGLVRSLELLLDGEVPQLLREHLDSPRSLVARLDADVHVGGDPELALSGKLAVVDHLVDRVLHVLVLAVGELDPGEVLARDPLHVLGRDAELGHVPGVDRDPAVGLRG